MINFLRISNNIKVGDFLHLDGTIDEKASSDVIGLCVIPSNFLPDKYARIMSLKFMDGRWDLFGTIHQENNYKTFVPGVKSAKEKCLFGFLFCKDPTLTSPYLPDHSFNPDFIRDLDGGNAFQDLKGYETTRRYKELYKNLEGTAFSICSNLAPNYKKTEWYLPAIGELACLIARKNLIFSKCRATIKAGSRTFLPDTDFWSSTEKGLGMAWVFGMSDGYVNDLYKQNSKSVIPFLAL